MDSTIRLASLPKRKPNRALVMARIRVNHAVELARASAAIVSSMSDASRRRVVSQTAEDFRENFGEDDLSAFFVLLADRLNAAGYAEMARLVRDCDTRPVTDHSLSS